jgi:hypothetical protein
MPLAATWSERFYQPRLADAKVDSPDFTGFHRISPAFIRSRAVLLLLGHKVELSLALERRIQPAR